MKITNNTSTTYLPPPPCAFSRMLKPEALNLFKCSIGHCITHLCPVLPVGVLTNVIENDCFEGFEIF